MSRVRVGLLAAVLAGMAAVLVWPIGDVVRSARDMLAWQVQAGSPDLSDYMVSMPDGVKLATDVYMPDTASPSPVVLMRLPYGKRSYGEVRFWVEKLTRRGIVVVAQDMRGRHRSEGVFSPYAHAGTDGAATLDWIIQQPWSNGKVGTLGCSALGEAQLMLAAQNHPAHRAMVPIAAGGAIGTVAGSNAFFSSFEGGVFNLALSAGWFGTHGGKTAEHSAYLPIDGLDLSHLPIIDIVKLQRSDPTDFEDFLRNFEMPDYWEEMGYVTGAEDFSTPALFIDTWHDVGVRSTFTLADTLRRSGAPVSIVMAAGTHCNYLGSNEAQMIGDLAVNPATEFDFVDLITRFFLHHLDGGPTVDPAYLKYYALVEDHWRTAESWPPDAARKRAFFLSGAGSLVSETAEHEPSQLSFISDPSDPVPSVGGSICCTGNPDEVAGPVFQNVLGNRSDVLVYASDPLETQVRVAGPLSVRLHVSADTPDTDLVVQLMDVDRDGNALLIQDGALRLRYRNGFDRPELLAPGEIYDVTVEMRDIAYLFREGHHLRLHVAGTSFPRLERNLNTGRENYLETEGQPAEITIHSGPDVPSAITLFTLPD